MAKADSPTKLCGEDGCGRPLRARGLCATHYNQKILSPEKRHPKAMLECAWCGKSTTKDLGRERRYASVFCSLFCRDAMRSYETGCVACPISIWHKAHSDYKPPLPVLWRKPSPPPPRSVAPRRFVCGACVRCGNPYIAEDYTDTARYCSTRCAKATGRERRRARKRAAYVADISRIVIFDRDGWRCRLCGRMVKRTAVVPHALAPVIDHIISLANGGTHEPSNVQCAHFICNSRKSDHDPTVQLLLFG